MVIIIEEARSEWSPEGGDHDGEARGLPDETALSLYYGGHTNLHVMKQHRTKYTHIPSQDTCDLPGTPLFLACLYQVL